MTDVDGELAYIDQELIYRQYHYDLGAFASYLFNAFQRFSSSTAGSATSIRQHLLRVRVFLRRRLPLVPATNTTSDSAAGISMPTSGRPWSRQLVFGATAPVIGQSYRLEITPTFGTSNHVNRWPTTVNTSCPSAFDPAAGGLHHGRFGSGAADSRLWPISLGLPERRSGPTTTSSFESDETFDFNRTSATPCRRPTSSSAFRRSACSASAAGTMGSSRIHVVRLLRRWQRPVAPTRPRPRTRPSSRRARSSSRCEATASGSGPNCSGSLSWASAMWTRSHRPTRNHTSRSRLSGAS